MSNIQKKPRQNIVQKDIDDADAIIHGMTKGLRLGEQLDLYGMDAHKFFDILTLYPDVHQKYHSAQKIKSELLIEEIIHIADTEPDVQRSTIMVNTRKWYASKMIPNKYGDKIEVNVSGSIDLNQAIMDAKQRVEKIEDAQIVSEEKIDPLS